LSREEHRLRAFENGMVRKIFGPNRDEIIGGWERTALMKSLISCAARKI
jgi:hypothetical protein